jgi:hypothetical protein
MTVPGAARECARPCARLGRDHGPLVGRPLAPLDDLFHALTEHGRRGDGNGTRSLIRFGCRELGVSPVRRQGLEPRTVALRGHCSAN